MAFRNPIRSLPASSIIGPIPGSQISGPVASATSATSAVSVTGPIDGTQVTLGSLPGPAVATGSLTYSQLTKSIVNAIGQKWWDFGDSASRWTWQGTPTVTSQNVADASGGTVMRIAGYGILWRPDVLVPFDPRSLYRVSVTARQTVAGADTSQQRVYFGLAGLAADRTTFVNVSGANSTSSQAYCAARNVNLTAGAGWQTWTGYVKGWAASTGDAGPNNDLRTPMKLHPGVRFITPILYANYSSGTGTMEVDSVSIEIVNTGAVDGTVNVIPGTIVADTLAADAIDGKTITGVTVNAAQLNGASIDGVTITGTSTVTGATVQTSDTGPRVVVGPDDAIRFYSGAASETAPGVIRANVSTDAGVTTAYLDIVAPQIGAITPESISLRTATDGTQGASIGGFSMFTDTAGDQHATLMGDLTITGAPGDEGLHLQGGTVATTDSVAMILTLASGYVGHNGYDAPSVERMPDGWIRAWGRFDTPASWTSGATIATLPAGMAPSLPWIFPGRSMTTSTAAAVSIEPTGAVRLWNVGGGTPVDVSLAGLAWKPAGQV